MNYSEGCIIPGNTDHQNKN